jgi:c-di-GMP-binding flagellar brake protein YcgR
MVEGLNFEINKKIEIAWNDGYYKSNIENVENNCIAISIPIKNGTYIPLREGEKVEVIYYYGKDIYKFYTHVIDRKIDTIPVILLALPKEVFKVQRRKFVRVPIICTIQYSKIGKNTASKPLSAIMVDLSGGGMRIKLKDELAYGDIINVYIPLGKEQVQIKGEIVRIEAEQDIKRNICGVSFMDLEERVREKLIRYIFQVMRDQMKKGK